MISAPVIGNFHKYRAWCKTIEQNTNLSSFRIDLQAKLTEIGRFESELIRIMTKNKKPFEISLKSNSKNILIEISKPCDVNQTKLVDKLIKIISDVVKNEDIK